MVYDPLRGVVVLFGGTTEAPNLGTPLDDTWTWDGSDWTEELPAHSPPARYVAAMAFDPGSATTILFGGAKATVDYLGDTWAWDGTDWTHLFPDVAPSARGWGAMAFDSNGHALLFGGYEADPGQTSGSFSYGRKPTIVRILGRAGGTVATGNAVTSAHPLKTSVTAGATKAGGMVSITQTRSTETAPHGYVFVDAQATIVAPRASLASPLTLAFRLDHSLVSSPPVDVFRARTERSAPVKVGVCTSESPPHPDPCVASETAASGGLQVRVKTSRASTWSFAVHRPDAAIKPGPAASYVGGGVYNLTGVGQTSTADARRGSTKTFDVAVQNRSDVADSFRLKGQGDSPNFTVKYLAGRTGTTNITAAVEAGSYTLSNVAPGDTKYIRMLITVKGTAPIGGVFSRLVTATSVRARVAKDAVKGLVDVVG
jgi:hypothetical protein